MQFCPCKDGKGHHLKRLTGLKLVPPQNTEGTEGESLQVEQVTLFILSIIFFYRNSTEGRRNEKGKKKTESAELTGERGSQDTNRQTNN